MSARQATAKKRQQIVDEFKGALDGEPLARARLEEQSQRTHRPWASVCCEPEPHLVKNDLLAMLQPLARVSRVRARAVPSERRATCLCLKSCLHFWSWLWPQIR